MKRFMVLVMVVISTCNIFAQNEKRIALVIGNSNYLGENTLKNPVNDANLMASTLTQLGFTVIKRTDVNRQQMAIVIADFWSKLGQYNVALFYYAGHGVAVNGTNYLLPVDAQMNDATSVELDAISVSSIVAKFDKYPNNTNILILDACRNNPFKDKRGSDRGFKAISPSKGTLIAFAAADGEFASDNITGSNGLFTEKLVTQMEQPVMIEQVFKKTRSLVQSASNNTQNPMEWNMLNNDFYFVEPTNGFVQKTEIATPKPTVEEETLTGTLKLNSSIAGIFYIDGDSSGNFSIGKVYTLRNIPVGEHTLKVGDWSKKVLLEVNKELEIYCFDESKIAIGKTYAGGIIFYVDKTGQHGLVCAPNDQGKAMCGCDSEFPVGSKNQINSNQEASKTWSDGTAIGSGNQNTTDIVSNCNKKTAARICYDLELNGYSDWFLPSRDELGLMYTNLKAKGLGNFSNGSYWSSSKYIYSSLAWYCNFGNGNIMYSQFAFKSNQVRAVRAF